MNRMPFRISLLAAVLLSSAAVPALAQVRQEARVLVAAEVLKELRSQRDQQIPERLLQQAYGVAVIPSVNKVAFILGARHGNGVLSVRDSHGRFTQPVFVSLTGGGVGWQAGFEEADVVLVFTTQKGVERIGNGKLTLGGNASVAAGPVGRQGEAAVSTDAEVLAYSRTRGLFAGVSLDGTAITMDNKANRAYYGRDDLVPQDVLSGAVTTTSASAQTFLAELTAGTGDRAAASATTPAAAGAPAAAPPPATPPAGAEVRTFPMEDTKPGAEPPR